MAQTEEVDSMYKGRITSRITSSITKLQEYLFYLQLVMVGNSGWEVPISVPHSPIFLQQLTSSYCLDDSKDASGGVDMLRIIRFIMKSSGYTSDSTNFCKDFIQIIMHALRQF